MKKRFLAFDLGAESGRTVLGTLAGGRLELRVLHRFANGPVSSAGHLHWDVSCLLAEIKKGMALSAAEHSAPASLAVDTWGVDFGLYDSGDRLIEPPFCYRDCRTDGVMERFFELLPRRRVYELTGIQFMPLNTLFQLFAMVLEHSPALKQARTLRFMPDIFNFLLAGVRTTEFTFATTSQLYDPRRGAWAEELFAALGLSPELMQKIVPAGTVLAPLKEDLARGTGLPRIPLAASASHDTAAAVAAVPAADSGWAFISSGTWSLMGIENPRPIIDEGALAFNFTNEGGIKGTFRFLKNITGLWLLQACRRDWEGEAAVPDYAALMELAAAAPAFRSLVDPDDPGFLNPPHMPRAIQDCCRRSGQPQPETFGQFSRCILESLALKYRLVLDQLRRLGPRPIERLHVIGGGSQNLLLNQFTADATGLPVLAGPVEATAVGNILGQAMALGEVASHREAREIVASSFPPARFEPRPSAAWEQANERFSGLVAQ